MRIGIALLSLAAGLWATGCGYSAGLRVGERTGRVGVQFFGNDTYERDLEPLLNDHLTHFLRAQSDVRLVPPSEADTVLEGTITRYHRRGGIRSTDNKLLETGVYIEAEAHIHQRGSEIVLRSARASSWVGYTLDQPSGEQDARDRALEHVAQELVLDLFTPQG